MTTVLNIHEDSSTCHDMVTMVSVLCTPSQIKCYRTFYDLALIFFNQSSVLGVFFQQHNHILLFPSCAIELDCCSENY